MDEANDLPLDEHFRRALDSILDLVVVERAIRDEHGEIVDFRIEWMNNAPVDVARRPREEMIGRRISELYPALAGGELIASYRRVVETGEPMIVEVLPYEDVIDGQHVSGFYTVQASRFEDGVLVASRDITPLEASRRELESALHELGRTLEELEAAQRLAQLGIWRMDLASGRLQVSRELRRMYEVGEGEALEHSMRVVARRIHPDDVSIATAAYERAIQTREAVVVEHRVVLADGSLGHVRSYVQPVVEDGEVVGLWGTTQDITERVATRDAFDAEHERRLTAEALAGLGNELSTAEDTNGVIDAVFAALAETGDLVAAVIGLLEDDGEPTLCHYFGGPGLATEIEARYRRTPMSPDIPTAVAIETDASIMFSEFEPAAAAFPRMAPDLAAMGGASFVAIPLRGAGGEPLGAIAFAWGTPRPFDADLVGLLEGVAGLAARTIERLAVRQLERSVAETLQLGLLALDNRTTAAVVRARYQAADTGLEIGGDWYDAVDLGDDRLAVAVGDVVGRGLAAATTMGQLRAALGVTSLQATDAAHAVYILDRYAKHVPGARCATVAFAMLDLRHERLSYLSAGHPPPLLVTPDGAVDFLEDGASWPLGIETTLARRPAATAALPAGSLLLLYTDGLVERPGESLDVGLERLRSVVRDHWQLPLRRLKQAIFSALVDERATDDVALVAVRSCGSGPHLYATAFPARAEELRGVRHRLVDWLEGRGIVAEDREAVLLGVGEALANAVEHGSRDAEDVVRLEAALLPDELIVSVSDSGQWQPGIEGFFTGRGRGHLLMRALSDDVDVDTDRHGTIVTLQFARQSELA